MSLREPLRGRQRRNTDRAGIETFHEHLVLAPEAGAVSNMESSSRCLPLLLWLQAGFLHQYSRVSQLILRASNTDWQTPDTEKVSSYWPYPGIQIDLQCRFPNRCDHRTRAYHGEEHVHRRAHCVCAHPGGGGSAGRGVVLDRHTLHPSSARPVAESAVSPGSDTANSGRPVTRSAPSQ
jgi:hypothetical protein